MATIPVLTGAQIEAKYGKYAYVEAGGGAISINPPWPAQNLVEVLDQVEGLDRRD